MVDPNVSVAGTFVASVLEHVGYLYQSRFLFEFQSFFRDAGALIYLIAAVGAVIAITMYGSTRAAQYLLIGPALFWFLVGPTTQTEGVRWKLGGGQYLGMFKQQGREQADQFITSVVNKMGEVDGEENDINVALGFYIFVKPINDIVNTMIDVILHREDTEDLMSQSKVQGLELISNALPYDHDHIHQIEEFTTQCSNYFNAASSAAELRSRQRGLQSARNNGSTVEDKTVTESYQSFRDRAVEHGQGGGERLDPGNSKFGELVNWLANSNSTSPDATALVQFAQQIRPRVQQGYHLKCEEAWRLLAGYTWFKAKERVVEVLGAGSGYRKYLEARRFTCSELTRKTLSRQTGQADTTSECALEPAISLYLLYNHWKSNDTFHRIVGRHNNARDLVNPKKGTIVSGPNNEGFVPLTVPNSSGGFSPVRNRNFSQQGHSFLQQKMFNPGDARTGEFGPGKVRTTWMPIAPISELRGQDHSMNVSSREFDTVRLKQELVSYARHLPYYQGVCLFLIAVAYPFLALIVLLPGKAQNFLLVPLMWAWVKSWDVGFAAIIVLDKVMYNLLPNWTLTPELRQGPWTTTDQLIEVLAQGFYFDPWASIHNYYAIMSMATLGIPALTGAVLVGSKRAILSSFSDGAAAQAKDRGKWAAAGFSVKAQSERTHLMMQVKSLSLLMSLHGGGGRIDQGSRGSTAAFYAFAQTAVKHLGAKQLQSLLKGDLQVLANTPAGAAGAFEDFIKNYKKDASEYADFVSQFHARWDPNIGIASVMQGDADAHTASLENRDSAYELNSIGDNPTTELLDLMLAQDSKMIKIKGQLYNQVGQYVGGAVKNPILVTAAATAVAVAGKEELKGGIGLRDLKKLSGDEALTDEEFLFSKFFLDKHSFSDPTLRPHIEELKDSNHPVYGRIGRDIHKIFIENKAGGSSSFVNLALNSTSLQRSVEDDPRQLAIPPTSISTDRNGAATVSDRIDSFRDAVSNLSGKDYPQAEIIAENGIRTFATAMKTNEDELNRKLSQYPFIRTHQNAVYGSRIEETYKEIVSIAGGPDKFVEEWNNHVSGNKIKFNESSNKLIYASGKEFRETDALLLVEKLSESSAYQAGYKKRLENFYNEDGVINTHERIQIESNLSNSSLARFKNKNGPISISDLAKQHPLVAMETGRNWYAEQNGLAQKSASGFEEASPLIYEPIGYGGNSSKE